MQVSNETLQEIADNLEAGLRCFLNKDNHELVTFPDEDRFLEMDTEVWQDDIGKIDKAPDKYIEIENMSPSDSYRVMEDLFIQLTTSFLKIN